MTTYTVWQVVGKLWPSGESKQVTAVSVALISAWHWFSCHHRCQSDLRWVSLKLPSNHTSVHRRISGAQGQSRHRGMCCPSPVPGVSLVRTPSPHAGRIWSSLMPVGFRKILLPASHSQDPALPIFPLRKKTSGFSQLDKIHSFLKTPDKPRRKFLLCVLYPATQNSRPV